MPIQSKQQPPYYQPSQQAIKQYIAKLTQSGTSAPIATIIKNDFNGTIEWTRQSLGTYKGTLTDVNDTFPETQTVFPNIASNLANIPCGTTTATDRLFTILYNDTTAISISTYDIDYNPIEWSAMIPPPNYITVIIQVYV